MSMQDRERVPRYFFPDIGNWNNTRYRNIADPIRGEKIFAVFTTEEKARDWISDGTPIFGVMRETLAECKKRARQFDCVGIVIDPERDENGDALMGRLEIDYLENPKESARHYLRRY